MIFTNAESWILITMALTFWTILYSVFCYKIFPKQNKEWNCRCSTTIHGMTVSVLSYICAFVQGPWPFTDPSGENTKLQHITCCLSMGYFIFDFLWCIIHCTEGFTMLSHHIVTLFGLTLVIFRNEGGTEMIACLFGSELTNPFLQVRYFLKRLSLHKSFFGELNDLTFLLLFTYLRIGVGSYLLYTYVQNPRPILIYKLGASAIYLISVIFWFSILKYAIRKYLKLFKQYRYQSKFSKLTYNGHSKLE